MLTLREARQRLSLINARIEFIRDTGEYRITLQEWPQFRVSTEERAYYTNDLDDALFTAQSMRREANSYGEASYLRSLQFRERYAFR
jgi:hypothetical protein